MNNDIIEISDLEINDNLGSNWEGPKKSTNFGGGLEFLMNDKIKDSNKQTSDIKKYIKEIREKMFVFFQNKEFPNSVVDGKIVGDCIYREDSYGGGKRKSEYTRTGQKHTTKQGKQYVVFMKKNNKYIRVKDKQTNKFVYKKVK